MSWLFHKPETVFPEFIESDEQFNTDGDNTFSDTGAHCSWCGDEPDEYGSHSICTFHAEQMLQQSAERAEARRRSRS
ncbi:MAG: hypothetical protein ACRDHZ_00420 [Ktedonobacteraceae bacterium]